MKLHEDLLKGRIEKTHLVLAGNYSKNGIFVAFMFKATAIFISILFITLAVFGFLNPKILGEHTLCGLACPLNNGVLASLMSFNNGSLAGSAFAVIFIVFIAFAIYSSIGTFLIEEMSSSALILPKFEEVLNLAFKKITFWFSLHEASPEK